jgi:hypothetical protein
LIQKADNGSLFIYDGADATGPKLTNSYQTTLSSQIQGTRTGFTYYSAVILWAVQLQRDLHVHGDVEVRAYISSSFGGFGLIDGGGYAMGLADVDQNQNIVSQFITEGPVSFGNPFTATPKLYTLKTTVDYVFKKGHSIGFFVGGGATVRGFTFNVYFDSSGNNSGATLPVENVVQTYRFNALWENVSYQVVVYSNSSLSNFAFTQSLNQVSFNASSIRGTTGYCQVWIPKLLLAGPFTVSVGSQQITHQDSSNSTHSLVDFTFTHSSDVIKITGTTSVAEFSSSLFLPLFLGIALLAAIFVKKLGRLNKTTI